MGGSQSEITNIGLEKGEGLRILKVKENSPLQTLVEPYFDFIIDLVPTQQSERSPKEILDKLTGDDTQTIKRRTRNFTSLLKQNLDKTVNLKIVSTKRRNIKNVDVYVNDKWGAEGDILGIDVRKERYDEVFDTYVPFSDINLNSPTKKAGIFQGQFLIGCQQFKYVSINEFIEHLYDRFYDKEVKEKIVNLLVFNLPRNQLRISQIQLSRNWGGKGLLGCQFLQGNLSRFPRNFNEVRDNLLNKQKKQEESRKIKSSIMESNGTSESLVEILRKNRNKRNKHLKDVKNIIAAPIILSLKKAQENVQIENEEHRSEQKVEKINYGDSLQEKRIVALEERVKSLQNTLLKITDYLESIDDEDGNQNEK